MTAVDVINQIKALPPGEQAKVIQFIETAKSNQDPKSAEFNQAAKWVFTEHAELMRRLSR